MTDGPARRRRRLIDQAVGGVLLFLIEVGVVVGLVVLAVVVAAVTLALT
jgi:hypothetical protein